MSIWLVLHSRSGIHTGHTADSHRDLLLLSLSVAIVGTLVGAVRYLGRNADGAYRLGYRVGWDEGRAAERLVRGDGPGSAIVLPLRPRKIDMRV